MLLSGYVYAKLHVTSVKLFGIHTCYETLKEVESFESNSEYAVMFLKGYGIECSILNIFKFCLVFLLKNKS